jgi:hypothetical protein
MTQGAALRASVALLLISLWPRGMLMSIARFSRVATSQRNLGGTTRAQENVDVQWRDGRSPKRGTSDFGSLSG